MEGEGKSWQSTCYHFSWNVTLCYGRCPEEPHLQVAWQLVTPESMAPRSGSQHAAQGNQALHPPSSCTATISGERPGDHNHQDFPQKDCDTNGRRIAIQNLGGYCDTNGRSTDSTDTKSTPA